MNKFNNTLKTLEPTIPIILVLMFVSGLIVGRQTAQLIADNRDGKLIRTDDPIFFPDADEAQ